MKLTEDNYYSNESNIEYVSVSQFKQFFGALGIKGCEHKAMAELRGEIVHETTTPMLIGSYVDAWFGDDFDGWCAKHPEIYSSRGASKGELKNEFKHANVMIERCARDAYFMSMMDGDHQMILTGEINGVKCKAKLDACDGKKIVDLKTVQSITDTKYVRDFGHANFIEYWGYDTQLAVYRELYRQNYGKTLPCYIAAVSKEEHPDIEVIEISAPVMDDKLTAFATVLPHLQALKDGEEEPERCGVCDYCRDTKVLTGAISTDMIGVNLW